MTSRIVVHVGLPKAGSTSLQDVFASSLNLEWIGKGADTTFALPSMREMFRNYLPLISSHIVDIERVRTQFEPIFEKARTEGKDGVLASDEILSGIGFALYPGFGQTIYDITSTLARCFGDALTLMLVIREPQRWLRSYHRQLVKMGCRMDLQHFVVRELMYEHKSVFTALDYSRLLAFLDGTGIRHHAIMFEDLIGSDSARARWFESAGVRVAAPTFPHLHKTADQAEVDRMLAFNSRHPHRMGTGIGLNPFSRDELDSVHALRARVGAPHGTLLEAIENEQRVFQLKRQGMPDGPPPGEPAPTAKRDALLRERFARFNSELPRWFPEEALRHHGYIE